MAEITRPNFDQLWANGGAMLAPSASKIELGWTVEIPPHQYENFVQHRQDQALAYLMQRGIPEWDSSTEYFTAKSVVLFGGKLWIALANSQNQTPAVGSTYWAEMIPTDTAKKMRVKRVTAPYTLTADDKSCWLQVSGAGNIHVPANVFAQADWVIISKQSAGATTITGDTVVSIRNEYGKNSVLPGAGSRGSLVFESPSAVELTGGFQWL